MGVRLNIVIKTTELIETEHKYRPSRRIYCLSSYEKNSELKNFSMCNLRGMRRGAGTSFCVKQVARYLPLLKSSKIFKYKQRLA
jgi:hypothetical protein